MLVIKDQFNHRTYKLSQSPTVVQRGFSGWNYLRMDSLMLWALQVEVNIMGYGVCWGSDVIQNGCHLGFY